MDRVGRGKGAGRWGSMRSGRAAVAASRGSAVIRRYFAGQIRFHLDDDGKENQRVLAYRLSPALGIFERIEEGAAFHRTVPAVDTNIEARQHGCLPVRKAASAALCV